MDTNTLLCEVERSEAESALAHALTAAGIPYRTSGRDQAATLFFVPSRHFARARTIVDDNLVPPGSPPPFSETDGPDDGTRGAGAIDFTEGVEAADAPTGGRGRPVLAVPFPWRTVETVLATVMFHTGLLFWAGGALPSARILREHATVASAAPLAEPWRLVAALFVHASLADVIWSGLLMLVFAVPVAGWLGGRRSAAIYLAAGVAGVLVAAWLTPPGAAVAGSAPAVAGLFGAWLGVALRRGRREGLGWRSAVRSLGIAVLVLPGVLGLGQPGETRSGHVGGTLAGMAAGLALALPARSGARAS